MCEFIVHGLRFKRNIPAFTTGCLRIEFVIGIVDTVFQLMTADGIIIKIDFGTYITNG